MTTQIFTSTRELDRFERLVQCVSHHWEKFLSSHDSNVLTVGNHHELMKLIILWQLTIHRSTFRIWIDLRSITIHSKLDHYCHLKPPLRPWGKRTMATNQMLQKGHHPRSLFLSTFPWFVEIVNTWIRYKRSFLIFCACPNHLKQQSLILFLFY